MSINRPPKLRSNVLANFAGKAWSGIMGILFVPWYLKYLGIESYGLIGLFVSLMALLSILDMGLSSTLSRELARLSVIPGTEQESRDLVRTMELIYWTVGALIALSTIALAPHLARFWLNPKGVSEETIRHAVVIMGFVIAFEWPAALYTGGLMGMQSQVSLNMIRGCMATVQSVGAVIILSLVSPTVIAYFKWQVLVSFLQTTALAASLWSCMPLPAGKTVFRKSLLKKNYRFAAGMTGIAITVALLTQLDKIVLSKMLSLEMFGYYILAFSVSNIMNLLVQPAFSAIFPVFSQLVAEENEKDLSKLYHKSCQFVSMVVLPIGTTIAFFSKELLGIWLSNPIAAENASRILSVLLIGSMFNATLTLPYTLQLAYGWTKLSFYKNILASAILIPLLLWMVRAHGAIGAAFVWTILNVGYFLFEIPFMHSRLLRGDMRKWYVSDVGLPFLLVACIGWISSIAMPTNSSRLVVISWCAATSVFCAIAVIVVSSDLRKELRFAPANQGGGTQERRR